MRHRDLYGPASGLIEIQQVIDRFNPDRMQMCRHALLHGNTEPWKILLKDEDALREDLIRSIKFDKIEAVGGLTPAQIRRRILDVLPGTRFRYLDLSGCIELTDNDLKKILYASKDIYELKLVKCSGFTKGSLRYLRKYAKQLKILEIKKTYLLDVAEELRCLGCCLDVLSEEPKRTLPEESKKIPDEFICKLVMLGAVSGKTSIMERYLEDAFSISQHPTIGVHFGIKDVFFRSKNIKLQIWDTSSQRLFPDIIVSYFRGTAGFIISYFI
jgi:hypothetical protein